MERVVEPELLDELPPGDPHATKSRRDLRRLNSFMANASSIAEVLAECPQPTRVLDMGAGDGQFSLALARKLKWRGTKFILMDRVAFASDEVRAGFRDLGCSLALRQCDVLTGFGEEDRSDAAFANLFLHHFEREELIHLLTNVASRCNLFVACEPRRSRWALLGSYCVGFLGCNAVTRHDAVVSVRAGFNGDELSHLWPENEGWSLSERAAGLFSHLFVAKKL